MLFKRLKEMIISGIQVSSLIACILDDYNLSQISTCLQSHVAVYANIDECEGIGFRDSF